MRELCEGNLEAGTFTRDPEVYVEKYSGDGHLSQYGPRWGTWKGLINQGLCYMDKGSSRRGASLSEGVL